MEVLIGKGRTAAVYEGSCSDQVVKLFFEWCSREMVEHEYRAARAVAMAGLPVPYVGDMVQLEGRWGIVYQRVQGESMLRALLSRPGSVLSRARQLAAEQVRIHGCSVPGLPSLQQELARGIKRAELRDPLKQQALALLQQLPSGEALCHGDYHPDNVIINGKDLIVIDWNNATTGHPLADVARTSLLLTVAEIPASRPLIWLLKLWKKVFHDAYVGHYLQLTGHTRQELSRWLIPLAAARLSENVSGEKASLHRLLTTWLD